MNRGRITKLIGGLYTVRNLKTDEIKELRAAGKLRHQKVKDSKDYKKMGKSEVRHIKMEPKVGDIVKYDNLIHEVEDRHNSLIRPCISNIDQAILVFSTKEPDFSLNLLDRFLCVIEHNDVLPVIIVNKIDLLSKAHLDVIQEKLKYYEEYYDVYYCSADNETNLDTVKGLFKDKLSVITGQTGVGKSSLLNALNIDLKLETGEVSLALGRGRHTTRHTELLEVYDGYVADSPGFSHLDFKHLEMEKDDVIAGFVDFFEHSAKCKFRGCTHSSEPGCHVKELVSKGEILQERYDNYISFIEEFN